MMQISKNDLKRIIDEEVEGVLNEGGFGGHDPGTRIVPGQWERRREQARARASGRPGPAADRAVYASDLEEPPIRELDPEMRLVGGLQDLVDAWRPRTPEGKKYQQDVEDLLAKSRGE